MKLNIETIEYMDFSHIRCNGTVNCYIELKDGQSLELYGLSLRQADQLEALKKGTVNIDDRFLSQSSEQWLEQNGIKRGA